MTGIESVTGFLASLRATRPLIFLAVAIASGIILFAPGGLATTLGLVAFRQQHRLVLGAAFVLSLAIVLVNVLYKIGVALTTGSIAMRGCATSL